MFESNSRYASLSIKTIEVSTADGQSRLVRYVERRFLPAAGTGTTMVEHVVVQGDRLDNITAQYLGDPTRFWQVADANATMQPEELTEDVGRRIVIQLPR